MQIVDAGYGHAGQALLLEILERPLFAHFATACPDGPRVSPVWFLYERGAVWIVANEKDSFWKRVRADPRCALEIVDFDVSSGRVHHAGMRGRAEVLPWEPERARRLLQRYLGPEQARWDARFRSAAGDYTNRWIRFDPQSAVIRDQSYLPG
ncbi:MAG TPA: pyridoxamine 5'-phosphate oxidase family protein [Candidatus Baltobacteraceae bacterium]|nr:pyridoxamine 5'-phosphate oxidase family protein [Candidatus Baltobacteraceae bacterium]